MPAYVEQSLRSDNVPSLRQLAGDVLTNLRRNEMAIDDITLLKEVLTRTPKYH